jgi:hypothetical protein
MLLRFGKQQKKKMSIEPIGGLNHLTNSSFIPRIVLKWVIPFFFFFHFVIYKSDNIKPAQTE